MLYRGLQEVRLWKPTANSDVALGLSSFVHRLCARLETWVYTKPHTHKSNLLLTIYGFVRQLSIGIMHTADGLLSLRVREYGH